MRSKRVKAALGMWMALLLMMGGCLAGAFAEEAGAAEEAAPAEAFDPLPLEGAAPYPPVDSALSADGYAYDDGTLSVRVVPDMAHDTKIYYVYVKITDASQLRTATAGAPKSQVQAKATSMALRNNAVLAINGDFYCGHTSGIVYRQGQLVRHVPAYTRDGLILDENGDLHILPAVSAKDIEAFQAEHEIRDAFCFGPGLIIDGERAVFNYRDKTSCGYPTRAQRMIFCQTGPLEYLFFATEGPEQDQPGLTVPECVELLEALGTVKQAYNLDGGNSTSIVLGGEKLNAQGYKIRDIGDIIYFATLVKP